MDQLYLGGSMFIQRDIDARRKEAEEFKKYDLKVSVFNPIDAPFNDKANSKPTAEQIFWGDTNKIINSKYVVAEVEMNMDNGLCYELGIASGINIVLDMLLKGMTKEEILSKVPKKTILGHCSDIRLNSEGYEGYRVPFGLNQYVIGGMLSNGKIFDNFYKIIDYIK